VTEEQGSQIIEQPGRGGWEGADKQGRATRTTTPRATRAGLTEAQPAEKRVPRVRQLTAAAAARNEACIPTLSGNGNQGAQAGI
jgi:hypothetical protein